MSFSIFMILNVSSCCSKRSFTTNFEPQSSRISSFTALNLLPGFSRSSRDDSMPCWSKMRRAKPMLVRM